MVLGRPRAGALRALALHLYLTTYDEEEGTAEIAKTAEQDFLCVLRGLRGFLFS
jgi:hypothetical protein